MKHAGLALIRSPGTSDGKIPDQKRPAWHQQTANVGRPDGYVEFFARRSAALGALPGCSKGKLTATSRTLVGHGLPSAHDVGLSLHHTYGVPYLPGSGIKGMLAHYVHSVLGSADSQWIGPGLDKRGAVVSEPGAHFRALFGAAPSAADREGFEGLVSFHDALISPECKTPYLAVDVLTVHQKAYYNDAGKKGGPNDYDSPNPVSFITAKPKLEYELGLSGVDAWVVTALELLVEAFAHFGIGGKTSSGYGRFRLEPIWSPEEQEIRDVRRQKKEQEQARLEAERLERVAAEESQKEAIAGLAEAVRRVSTPADISVLEGALGRAEQVPRERVVELLKGRKGNRKPWRKWLTRLAERRPEWAAVLEAATAPQQVASPAAKKGLAPAGVPTPAGIPAPDWVPARMWNPDPEATQPKWRCEVENSTKAVVLKPHTLFLGDGEQKAYAGKKSKLELGISRPEKFNVQVALVGKKIKRVKLA